jgi:hypothetical protein
MPSSNSRLTPPAPLSNYASLRGEEGAGKTTRLFSPSPRSGEAAELERGLGGEAREARNWARFARNSKM